MNEFVIVTINKNPLRLTKEQKEVFDLRWQGYTNKQIREKLELSKATVSSRLGRIKTKYKKEFKEELVFPKILKDVFTQDHDDILVVEEQNELEFLRHQNIHLKRVLNKYKKGNVLEDRIIQLFNESIKSIAYGKKIKETKKKIKSSDEELVVCIGDVHAGEIIESEEILGLNHYNMDVMKERMNKLFNNVNSIISKMTGYTYSKLHIFFLGDMVSGLIHDELLAGTAIVDQVVDTGYILSEMIEKWSKKFPVIDVSAVVGNHGRLKKQVTHKKKYDNFDYLMYHMIQSRCKDLENVEFEIPKSPFLIKQIYKFNFLLTHGNSRIPSYAGIPFYGIRRMDGNITQTLAAEKGLFPHYTIMGHFHTNNTLDKAGMGKIIINGSMVGTNDFAFNSLFVSGEPKQTLFSVHKDYGVTCKFDILLTD